MQISRRNFVHHALLTSTAMSTTAIAAASTADITNEKVKPTSINLQSTALIQANHPRIIRLAKEIVGGEQSAPKAAVLVHDWVRDEIAFGIPSGFYETSATEVLDAKVGYCNTKVSLFQSLLRALSIPTRMRMMDLSAQVLQGLFDPGTSYVDHAITEVFLSDRWVQVDSYVVDSRLAAAARKKLLLSKNKAGFGIHLNGMSQWNGTSDNFIQYRNDETIANYVLKNHGIFADVLDFYKTVPEARNRKTFATSLAIRFGHGFINSQILKVRDFA
jgi:Transglutaminase-like superfamily